MMVEGLDLRPSWSHSLEVQGRKVVEYSEGYTLGGVSEIWTGRGGSSGTTWRRHGVKCMFMLIERQGLCWDRGSS